ESQSEIKIGPKAPAGGFRPKPKRLFFFLLSTLQMVNEMQQPVALRGLYAEIFTWSHPVSYYWHPRFFVLCICPAAAFERWLEEARRFEPLSRGSGCAAAEHAVCECSAGADSQTGRLHHGAGRPAAFFGSQSAGRCVFGHPGEACGGRRHRGRRSRPD